jgi:hypothetical protein
MNQEIIWSSHYPENISEVMNVLEIVNDKLFDLTGNEEIYCELRATYEHDMYVYFGNSILWSSEDDERFYDEDTNKIQDLKQYLEEKIISVINNYHNINF